MKVTVDIECTPEEARRFMGLPDISSLHEIYLEKMRSTLADSTAADLIGETLKTWGPMSESGIAAWSQIFGQSGTRK